jgi:diguanylate cyclase (GGDEF)-like protein/PAS domain S-box-containing protein
VTTPRHSNASAWIPGLQSFALLALLFGLAACLFASPVFADENSMAGSSLPRHPLEERALSEPEAVLKLLPDLIDNARKSGDSKELALLFLAQANACRVVADWPCQRVAGASAQKAAEAAHQPILLARALIAESRALIAMQDFSRGEELLGRAELVLKTSPSAELSSDVFLAYSSLSYSLGKVQLSAEYASRGLAVLSGDQALPMQVRLLRNLARAQSQLGQTKEADQSLQRARVLAERFDDPKLSAELLFGSARMAHAAGDVPSQIRSGERVLELAKRLKNSQLVGMGHEVIGLAALDSNDEQRAADELGTAYQSFRSLGLKRDELRVLRELLRLAIDQKQSSAAIEAMTLRFLSIDSEIEASDRAKAADDFDARLKYAEREFELLRLKDEAVLARERERALALSNRQSQALSLSAAALLIVLSVFFILQRRSNRQLQTTLALLRDSEARANDLLNLSAGFVFLHDTHGKLVLVNPATAQALGRTADALVGRSLGEFQPRGSRDAFNAYLARLQAKGEDEGVFLVRSGQGDHRHWRYSSRLSAPQNGSAYVVGNAVDVTDQIHETRVLHEQSVRDALTGSYNRRQLEIFEGNHPAREPWAAISVDLDHFKLINDSQGHDRGDQVLIEIAQFLLERVRADDAVVRLGGDEFVVLLSRADTETLGSIANRLRQDASAAPCAFTIGTAMRDGGESLSATIARADADMYAARASARSRQHSDFPVEQEQ